MKKIKPVKEDISDSIPFSFVAKKVDEKKIKAHWEKIKEKIELDGRTKSNSNNRGGYTE